MRYRQCKALCFSSKALLQCSQSVSQEVVFLQCQHIPGKLRCRYFLPAPVYYTFQMFVVSGFCLYAKYPGIAWAWWPGSSARPGCQFRQPLLLHNDVCSYCSVDQVRGRLVDQYPINQSIFQLNKSFFYQVMQMYNAKILSFVGNQELRYFFFS